MNQKRTIETERGTVAYFISGEEKEHTLFFCHGLTADHTLFFYQEKAYGEKYCVICLDTPLHGASRPYKDFSFAHVAEDMNQILVKEGRKKAIFLGQSLGGYNCQAFYLKYPEKMEGFISIDSTPLGDYYTSKMDRFWLRHAKGMAMCYPRKLMISAAAKAACHTKEAEQSFAESLQQYTKREIDEMYGICYRSYLEYHDTVSLMCPVLLLLGEHDKTGKVVRYNQMWTEKEGYPFVIISQAGHNSNYDNYLAVNEQIEKFADTIWHANLGMLPSKKQNLYIISGASGIAKSSLCEILFQRETEYLVMESDILWQEIYNTPEDDYKNYRKLWMRLCANISQIGMPVVLCGCGEPKQFELQEERAMFATIHYLAVVCEEQEVERRMREGREITDENWIRSSLDFNRWLKENAALTTPPITLLDTTKLTIQQAAAYTDQWIREREKGVQ